MHEIDADTLVVMLESARPPLLVDVRSAREFSEWAIPGAVNIPLDELEDRIDEIPRRPLVTVCARGSRARDASSVLGAHHRDASVLAGGMQAWSRSYDLAEIDVGGAAVIQLRRRGTGCLSYLVGAGDACLVVDPSLDIDRYQALADAHGWSITAVADTHVHADHLSGVRALSGAAGATVVTDRYGVIAFGTPGTVRALPTPGHTPESTTFVVNEAAILTGDVLFVDGVGRPDLADEADRFAEDLYDSLHSRLFALPRATLVLPAHVGAHVDVEAGEVVTATLGSLRSSLAPLSLDRDAFVAWATTRATPAPTSYAKIVEVNRRGTTLRDEERSELEGGPNQCAIAPH